MAGRKPKPTALKKLEGNPGKRKPKRNTHSYHGKKCTTGTCGKKYGKNTKLHLKKVVGTYGKNKR